jgi:hypothetical protein
VRYEQGDEERLDVVLAIALRHIGDALLKLFEEGRDEPGARSRPSRAVDPRLPHT